MVLRPAHRSAGRSGLTILEVIVSLAIFLLALVGIGGLISFAGERALDVQYQTRALQIAQSKLAEVTAGAIPLSGSSDSAVEEDDNYRWSLSAEQGSVQGLWNITVTVTRQGAGGKVQVALSQMILDPSVVGSTQDIPGGASNSSSNNSTGSTSGSSSGTGTGTSSSTAATPVAATPAPAAMPASSTSSSKSGK
jgi:Tfp pilus assembly protein PilV